MYTVAILIESHFVAIVISVYAFKINQLTNCNYCYECSKCEMDTFANLVRQRMDLDQLWLQFVGTASGILSY